MRLQCCAAATQRAGPLCWNQTSVHARGWIKRKKLWETKNDIVLFAVHTQKAERQVCVCNCASTKTKLLLMHPNAETACLSLCVCASEYMALRVYHNCIQIMLIGLVRPLKETEALFASDIKVGSECGGLLQSRQEEKPMHNAPLWTENIRAVGLPLARSSNSINSASPITSLSDSCDERREARREGRN